MSLNKRKHIQKEKMIDMIGDLNAQDFNMFEENEFRSQYNEDISICKYMRVYARYGIIREAYYKYLSNFGLFPHNTMIPKKEKCRRCFKMFLSRNTLFKHLYETNHYDYNYNDLYLEHATSRLRIQ
jgi:hypothetical protein